MILALESLSKNLNSGLEVAHWFEGGVSLALISLLSKAS